MKTKFNFNSQICTTRKQSEHLLELGLKKETADMQLARTDAFKDIELIIPYPPNGEGEDIPAWSLNRLIEMMPLDVVPEGGFNNIFTLTKDSIGYSVEYDGFSYYYNKNIYDTLIEGIEHLIKEGYFNKEYLV